MIDRKEPAQIIEQRAASAINILQRTPVESTRTLVNRVIDQKTTAVRFLIPGEQIASISSFFIDKNLATGMYMPTILLDPKKIQGVHETVVAADLVRSFALAAAYPEAETERAVAVYNRAMDEQQRWLDDLANTQKPQRVFYNPHVNRNHMIAGLIGHANFYYDTGFADWETAVGGVAAYYQDNPYAVHLLDQWQHDKDVYLEMRDRYHISVYEKPGVDRDKFTKLPADERALFTASAYVRLAIEEEKTRRRQSHTS